MKIQHFEYKPKKVNSDGITFDSKLEYSMYKILRIYKNIIDIRVHSKIYTGWSIDFDLVPKGIQGVRLLGKLAVFTGRSCPSRILIEVKGITDKNFLRRYNQIIGSEVDNILVLASKDAGAIGYEASNNQVICKPIVPIRMIRDILRG